MKKIRYTEQFFAIIFACLGCMFVLSGLLCFVGIIKPSSGSWIQDQNGMGIVLSGIGIVFLVVQTALIFLACAKEKMSHTLIANGMKVTGTVETVYSQWYLQCGKKSPYRVLYRYSAQGKLYHHKSQLLWEKPTVKEGDSIEVYCADSGKSAVLL